MLRAYLMAGSAWALAASAAPAAEPVDLAAAFGARQDVYSMQLSPSGNQVVYLGPSGGDNYGVVVADVATGKARAVVTDNQFKSDFQWCAFKTETRLICRLGGVSMFNGDNVDFARTIVFNTDGSNPIEIGGQQNARSLGTYFFTGGIVDWLADDPDNVLMQIYALPEETVGTRLANKNGGMTVQRVNIHNRRAQIVVPARQEAGGFSTDGAGNVRLMEMYDIGPAGIYSGAARFLMRPTGSNQWEQFETTDIRYWSASELAGFDESGQWVYMLKPYDGRKALHRVSADGMHRTELVYANPNYDVSDVLRIGKYRRPVAALYYADSLEMHYLDPAIQKLMQSLARALPQQPLVNIVDESWDGKKKLVFAGSDTDPGRYYLYDSSTRNLAELTPVRPALDGMKLGSVKSVTYPSRDGVAIPGYLTLPPDRDAKARPAIIMPHGGPSSRDVRGFDWLAQYFAKLGYVVLQANYRGSTGYGEGWFQKNGFQSWRTAMNDINDGARWLGSQGIADPARIAIFGWSYGGYAALQANISEPGLYKAAVAVAPLTDLQQLKDATYDSMARRLIHDAIGSGPHITEGSPARNAERISVPVLMFHGDKDTNVDIAQSRMMDAALRKAGKASELIVYPGLDHQLDHSTVRADLLRKSAAFLKSAIGD